MVEKVSPVGRLRIQWNGADKETNRWVLVLAGGEGERMRPVIEEWLGHHRPKQYCSFVGTRSMLQHTLDRARRLVGSEQIITVIGRGHSGFLQAEDSRAIPGRVIEQPDNRDTAPGIFLGLTYILAEDPNAIVLVFPSDHFIFPESRFLSYANKAARLAQSLPDRLLLLGAAPDGPEPEYGWIEPGEEKRVPSGSSGVTPKQVLGFREKPSPAEALHFFASGYLWNTMVMAAKAKTLWQLGHRYFPALMTRFEALQRVLQAIAARRVSHSHEQVALSHIYQELPRTNFSRGLLQQAPEHSLLLPMTGVEWSDWGSPARVVDTLARIGKHPAFPVSSPCITAPTPKTPAAFGLGSKDNGKFYEGISGRVEPGSGSLPGSPANSPPE